MSKETVVGIIIGEGCFQISLHERESSKFNVLSRPTFYLSMKDEKELIKEMVEVADVGYYNSYSNSSPPVSRWEVTSIKECKELSNFIEKNSNQVWKASRKYESFKIWSSLIDERKELHKTKSGMHELIDKSNSINPDGERKVDYHKIVSNNS